MVSSLRNLIDEKLSSSSSRLSTIGGGSINDTFRIEASDSRFFCKVNSAKKFPGLFEKEKSGLLFLQSRNVIRVPKVIWCGEHENMQVLILEWIEQGIRSDAFWKKFGEQLARLHRPSDRDGQTSQRSDRGGQTGIRLAVPTAFGFHEDNYMGALQQVNTWTATWIEFFIHCRLQPQLDLAEKSGLVKKNDIDQFHRLYQKLEEIFPTEPPCALHGDLWSGNFLCSDSSEPVLIDPAVYYGHRCMDLGMTKLFGGFDKQFYDAYDHHFPLPKNFEEQAGVCNLYPLLIHLNLFGSGYLNSIRTILKAYC